MAKKPIEDKSKKLPKKTYSPGELKPHHSKPYRRRHYGLLIFSIIFTLTLSYLLASTSLANYGAVKSAKNLISKTLGQPTPNQNRISSDIISSYGFSLNYNPRLLHASALDISTNSLYVGGELSSARKYSSIRITPVASDPASESSSGSISVEYSPANPVGSSADLAKLEAQLVGAKNPNFTIVESSSPTVSGITMLKSEWSANSETNNSLVSTPSPTLISYTGVLNNIPIVLVSTSGLAQSEELRSAFESAINSLSFQDTSSFRVDRSVTAQTTSSLTILDRLMMTDNASAQSFLNKDNISERVSLLYGPSVVKIYNFYCMDVLLGGQMFVQQSCNASTGSGFFIGDQGYIATNGHVVVNDPLSIAITYAFEQASKGNMFYFSSLAQVAGLTQADIDAGSTDKEKLKIAVDKFYAIPSSQVSASNKTENILVGLGEEQPDMQKLFDATKYHSEFKTTDNIKEAKVVDYNYRAIDGAQTGFFTASDVSLLKIDGSGYPSTKIGSISSLMQGSGLSIIGFPGAASSNLLVEASESRPTLTSGKVSSIKSAAGSKSQLIETDATIGHGNSGGPAFNDTGEVVGIATYTIDGSGDGGGVFNYIRDIADLNELTRKNGVDTASLSQTQKEWEEAIKQIYQAHYSEAVSRLNVVKTLYPQHPRVDQLISLSQDKISSGEEAKEFPTLLAGIATLLGILLVSASIFLIIQHSRRHAAYKEHLATGKIAPPTTLDQLHQQQTVNSGPTDLANR